MPPGWPPRPHEPGRTVLFDNEAVQALIDVSHRKHRRVLAIVEGVAARGRPLAGSVRLAVPTSVRAEAGWDRHAPHAAAINRLRIDDIPLDTEMANRASQVVAALGVSVADAHLAASLDTSVAPHAVVTSDPDDIRRISGHLEVSVTILTV